MLVSLVVVAAAVVRDHLDLVSECLQVEYGLRAESQEQFAKSRVT